MPLDIVVGTQWGDEGKGRYVDLLAGQADFVARFNGGDNAGHTVAVGSQTFKLHLIPSGIVQPHTIGVIGNGVVVNPSILLDEINTLLESGIEISPRRLKLSYGAHLITPAHLALDKAQEASRGSGKIGTTLRGIGPAYTNKVSRQGIRLVDMLDFEEFKFTLERHVHDINQQLINLYRNEPIDPGSLIEELEQYASQITPFISDVSLLLTQSLEQGKKVLAEGAQGTLLDLDHGTYPYVTSSTPTAGGALVGLGLGPGFEGRVIGVTKSFQTRVGSGPFPTEIAGKEADKLRGTGEQPWDEFGTTTGRPRRVGWLDLVLLRYSIRINRTSELALTKLDILSGFDQLLLCTGYRRGENLFSELPYGPAKLDEFVPVYEELPGWSEDITGIRDWADLPANAKTYIQSIEELARVKVRLISVGPERDQVIENF